MSFLKIEVAVHLYQAHKSFLFNSITVVDFCPGLTEKLIQVCRKTLEFLVHICREFFDEILYLLSNYDQTKT